MNALKFNNQIANLITGFIANIPTIAQSYTYPLGAKLLYNI